MPVQTPANLCSQWSQEAIICLRCRQHKKSAAQEVQETKITTSLHSKRALHCMSLLCYNCNFAIISQVVYHYQPKNCSISGITLYIFEFSVSNNFLVTQRRILPRTKHMLNYIQHFVVPDVVISGFDCI